MSLINRHGINLRFGLVGTGRIAHTYAQAFTRTPNAQLVACTDLDSSALRKYAQETGSTAFPSHLEMADSGKIDAVIVATPPATHGAVCLDLLSRGIPVLCEKPVSFSAETARR